MNLRHGVYMDCALGASIWPSHVPLCKGRKQDPLTVPTCREKEGTSYGLMVPGRSGLPYYSYIALSFQVHVLMHGLVQCHLSGGMATGFVPESSAENPADMVEIICRTGTECLCLWAYVLDVAFAL